MYWSILEIYCFSGSYIPFPFIIIIIIILFASFLWVECLFNLWHKALASYFGTKIRERKRTGGWHRMRVDHVRQWLSASSFTCSAGYRADVPTMALPGLTDFKTLNFKFEKLNSFFLFLNSLYEGFGPNVYALDVIKNSWIPFFTAPQGRVDVPNVAGSEIDWLWDFVLQLRKVEFAYSPWFQLQWCMLVKNYVHLRSLGKGIFQTSSRLLSFSNLDCNRKKEKKTLPLALQTTSVVCNASGNVFFSFWNWNFGEKKSRDKGLKPFLEVQQLCKWIAYFVLYKFSWVNFVSKNPVWVSVFLFFFLCCTNIFVG